MTIVQVGECVGETHMRAMAPADTTEDVKRSGIFPNSAYLFEELDFLTSAVTDRPQETANLPKSSTNIEQDISVSEIAPSKIQLAECASEHTNENSASTSTYISPEQYQASHKFIPGKGGGGGN
jgi:hypothetical protein